MSQNILQSTPTLFHLSGDVTIGSFCPDGFVGIGVSIGTDTFVRNFVTKTYRVIVDDVEKLDSVIVVFFNSSMWTAKLRTHTLREVLV